MVNVAVWHTLIKDGGRISTFKCGEKDVENVVDQFVDEYGEIRSIVTENGECGKYSFHMFTEPYDGRSSYFIVLRVTKSQFERLYSKLIVLQKKESVERLLGRYKESNYENGIKECEKILSYFGDEQTSLSSF